MNKPLSFKAMHEQEKLLFLPNAWDVLSALVLEQAGFKAIGTTSRGVANAMGYKDGERVQFEDLLALVKKMIAIVEIPISVDIESGYSDNATVVVNNVLKIAELGASGINIEDSLKNSAGLNDKNTQCELISKIRNKLDGNGYHAFFINARTDTYLQKKNPLNDTIDRAIAYVNAGANGIFVPRLSQNDEMAKLVESIEAPLNVMSLPNLTDIDNLNKLGVKRFSLGPAFSNAAISFIEEQARILFTEQNTKNLHASCDIKTSFK
jgi:2-methylisocitrate lyase-like PEP mutase family enzyme